jgi:hypothetical protein
MPYFLQGKISETSVIYRYISLLVHADANGSYSPYLWFIARHWVQRNRVNLILNSKFLITKFFGKGF